MTTALKILLIEDDMIEIMKFNRVVKAMPIAHSIIEASNGEEGLKLLENKDELPDIILLDLNMPKINGIEFLSLLKKDAELQHIPTIILTTSSHQKDLIECYKLGVSGYILKPLKYEEYVYKIQTTLAYWSMNQLKL